MAAEATTITAVSVGTEGARQFQGLFKVIPFKFTIEEDSVADAAASAGNITVTGAALGDIVLIGMGVDVGDLGVSATVTAANTVTIVLENNTGGAVTALATPTECKGVVLTTDTDAFNQL